jgi:hypothetical protein
MGNGSVHTFLRQRVHATIDEMLEASFSMRSVSYQRKMGYQFFPELPDFSELLLGPH